jgi:hypothetical protein
MFNFKLILQEEIFLTLLLFICLPISPTVSRKRCYSRVIANWRLLYQSSILDFKHKRRNTSAIANWRLLYQSSVSDFQHEQ